MNNPLRYVDPSGMLLTDDPGHVDGYLQTYYGGEYHYYLAMDGSCNVSGDSYDYTTASELRAVFDIKYAELYGSKKDNSTKTEDAKKTLSLFTNRDFLRLIANVIHIKDSFPTFRYNNGTIVFFPWGVSVQTSLTVLHCDPNLVNPSFSNWKDYTWEQLGIDPVSSPDEFFTAYDTFGREFGEMAVYMTIATAGIGGLIGMTIGPTAALIFNVAETAYSFHSSQDAIYLGNLNFEMRRIMGDI